MAQAHSPAKNSVGSVIGVVIAAICILVYLGALVSIVVRINTNMEQQRLTAEQEFFDLADQASAAGVLSFMDETFVEIIQKNLDASKTLEGVIISGPNGEYGFEKERGKAINYVNGSPRFRNRIDLSGQQLYQSLRIQGLRNTNIEAKARLLDDAELRVILWQALLLVAAALLVALFALIIDSLQRKSEKAFSRPKAQSMPENKSAPNASGYAAGGSYSERGRVVREENTETRLTEELHRCAAMGQDLTFIVIEYKAVTDETFYARFTADAARFFSSRDFVCEKGERGISVICPDFNLDAGFLNADEFHNRVMGKYPALFTAKTDLCMGLSSRSGRPVNAERLMFEAEEALERAMMDPVSHIVAFRSDPEKYRAFMESRGQE